MSESGAVLQTCPRDTEVAQYGDTDAVGRVATGASVGACASVNLEATDVTRPLISTTQKRSRAADNLVLTHVERFGTRRKRSHSK